VPFSWSVSNGEKQLSGTSILCATLVNGGSGPLIASIYKKPLNADLGQPPRSFSVWVVNPDGEDSNDVPFNVT
jgi:hypothetical protein